MVQQPQRESDHSHPSSGDFKNAWSWNSTPPYTFTEYRCTLPAHERDLTYSFQLLNVFKFFLDGLNHKSSVF